MVGGAFVRGIVRSVRGSLGRFLAIMGITALGCGFYAGLAMCGPDMRAAADAWYDGSHLADLRVISTLGLGEDDLGRLASVEGVEAAMPSVTLDAMARLGDAQAAVRISTLDVRAAAAAQALGTTVVSSSDAGYLNRLRLVEGRWPAAARECVISADKDVPGVGVGSVIELLSTTEAADGLLAVPSFVVVGTVTSPSYPYTGNFGSTSLGAGMVSQYLYVSPASLAANGPYTEAYLRVAGAEGYESGGAAYEARVGEVRAAVEGRSKALAEARLADLRAEANSALEEREEELASRRADASARLDGARGELDASARRLADGAAALAAGERSHASGLAELSGQQLAAERRLAAGEAELAAGEAEVASGEAGLAAGAERLAAGEAELAAGEAEVASGEAGLAAGESAWQEASQSALAALADQGVAAGSVGEAQDAVAALLAEARAAANALGQASVAADALADAQLRLDDAAGDTAGLADVYDRAAGALAELGYTRGDVDAALDTASDAIAGRARELGASEEAIGRALSLLDQLRTLLAQARQLSDGRQEVAARTAELLSGLAERGITADSVGEARTALASARDEAASAIARLEEAQAGLAELASSRAELDAGRARLDEARARLAAGRAELASSRAELDAGRARLDEARARLAAGRAELASSRATAGAGLASARLRLDAAATTLAASRAELDAGRRAWEEGLASWQAAHAEADAGFSEADARLASARADIAGLVPGELYVLDRARSEGAATYDADTHRMDAIAAVFPLMFFLVAALVSLTTMTRMVEDERVAIGTYKALGYGSSAIAARYLAYAAAASVVGAAFGIAVLSQLLPLIVTSAYGIIYAVPELPLPLPVSLPVAFAAGGLGVGVTLLATWAAVVTSLREAPATLMLPRAPAAGKRILLERAGALWRRVSFSWKVTFRNLFRYKRRLTMTVIGISGCTALLLVGFGLHDAIWDIIDGQYGPVVHFDTTVGLDADADGADVDAVERYLAGTDEVSGIVRVSQRNMQARAAGTGAEPMRVQVIVPEREGKLPSVVTLRERVGHAPIAFDAASVVVTEKLALKYGLAPGGEIVLLDQDDTGNAVGDGRALTITGVAENYVGNLVYLGRDAWARMGEGEPAFSTLYATTTPDAAVRADVTEELHAMGHVSTVAFSDETIDVYRGMLSVVDMIVVVLIVSAGALAFIVLYNLTNINIGERVREIASLKVLGFTRREVYAYIFREVFLLAALGDVLGLVLGRHLASFVITTAEVDYVMFGRTIHPPSYAYAFALTLAFTAVVALLMRRRLDGVDMVESLKSVE